MGNAKSSHSSPLNLRKHPKHNTVTRPLKFHSCTGKNIVLKSGGIVAERCKSFCDGLVFTSECIDILEKVTICVQSVSASWSGALRIGVTTQDPSSWSGKNLPRYACPDLANEDGYWIKALPLFCCRKDCEITFYVDQGGVLHYAVDNGPTQEHLEGINSTECLWGMIDVYGNAKSIRLIGSQGRHMNLIAPHAKLPINMIQTVSARLYVQEKLEPLSFSATMGNGLKCRNLIQISRKHVAFESFIAFTGVGLEIGQSAYFYCAESKENVLVSSTDELKFGIGVTSCNPASVVIGELPIDADMLVDRPEYWIIHRDLDSPKENEYFAVTVEHNGTITYSKENVNKLTLFHADISQPLYVIIDLCNDVSSLAIVGISRKREIHLTSTYLGIDPAANLNHIGSSWIVNVDDPPANLLDIISPDSAQEVVKSMYPHEENFDSETILHYPHSSAYPHGDKVTTHGHATSTKLEAQQTSGSYPHESNNNLSQFDASKFRDDISGLEQMSLNSMRENTENVLSESDYHEATNDQMILSGALSVEQRRPEMPNHNFSVQNSDTSTSTYKSPESTASEYVKQSDSSKEAPSITKHDCPKDGPSECVICYDNISNSVIYPCGHACLCYDCGSNLKTRHKSICPICRADVKDIIRMYQ